MLQDFAWSPHLDEMDGAVEGRCRNPNVVLQSDSLKLLVVERIPLNITPCYMQSRTDIQTVFVWLYRTIFLAPTKALVCVCVITFVRMVCLQSVKARNTAKQRRTYARPGTETGFTILGVGNMPHQWQQGLSQGLDATIASTP